MAEWTDLLGKIWMLRQFIKIDENEGKNEDEWFSFSNNKNYLIILLFLITIYFSNNIDFFQLNILFQ